MRCIRCGAEFQPGDAIYLAFSGAWYCEDCYLDMRDETATQVDFEDAIYNNASHMRCLDDVREDYDE